jgi:dipeptidyl aminopeptidase/acylaminoacyl peptidase
MNRGRISGLFATAIACFCICALADELEPLDHFVRLAEYSDPKISPTGEYLGVIAPVNDQDSLVVIDLNAMQVSSVLRFVKGAEVLYFYWVNDERIICSFGKKRPRKGAILYSAGEIFAMNADGRKKKSIFGYQSALPMNAAGIVIDPLRDDHDNMLIAAYPFSRAGLADVTPKIYKLNVYNGVRKKQSPVPYRSSNFHVDGTGRIRVAHAVDDNFNSMVLYRDVGEREFRVLEELSHPNADVELLGMDSAGDRIYVADSRDGGPVGLSLYYPETGSVEQLWSNDKFDVLDLVWSADGSTVIGVTYYADKLKYAFFDAAHSDARTIISLQKVFEDKELEILNRTRDGKHSIFRVGSSTSPDEYYLFNSEKRNVERLLGSRNWINPARMSTAKYFQIAARDGQKLYGYLTMPSNGNGESLPLVVMPHGGPHGVRDTFSFDTEVQVLASRGYAVLQVNYRGSGGYGPAFIKAGYRKWGTLIQDDIADATNWAIDEGFADRKRVCIAGASFGGYSAMMSAVRYPELYRCAIGELGVYDLGLMYEEGDIADRDIGVDYLRTAIGTNDAEWTRQSPSRNVESIKADLFIVYGKHDDRAPPAQSIAMTSALDDAGISYELFVMRDEGHTFASETDRAERYARILKFLDKNIGSGITDH